MRTRYFPKSRVAVPHFPKKDKLWVFMMAGQSNMSGRGLVSPQDTISNQRIIALGKDKKWYEAKEPLHEYEPKHNGLDGGLSFAKYLLPHLPKDVVIALVPCAVGATHITQWNQDQTFRGVPLLSNFRQRLAIAQKKGVIKAVLWHQGEGDSFPEKIPFYAERSKQLFQKFRTYAGDQQLPILVGTLGDFNLKGTWYDHWKKINKIIIQAAKLDDHRFVVSAVGLKHKGDQVHFDAESQRILGRRFAEKYIQVMSLKSKGLE